MIEMNNVELFISVMDERFNDCNQPTDVPITNIVYLEALKDNGTRLYVAERGGIIHTYKSTYKMHKLRKRFERILPLRPVHRSFTVNLRFYFCSSAKCVYLTKGTEVDHTTYLKQCITVDFGGPDLRKDFRDYCSKHQIKGKRFELEQKH